MHWMSTRLKTGEHFVKKLLSQTVLHSLRHSLHHWRVGLRVSKTSLLDDGLQALSAFRWIDSPRGHFYADPMLFEHEGRIWLFVEDYLHATNRAQTILAAELSEDGSVDGLCLCSPGPIMCHIHWSSAIRTTSICCRKQPNITRSSCIDQ